MKKTIIPISAKNKTANDINKITLKIIAACIDNYLSSDHLETHYPVYSEMIEKELRHMKFYFLKKAYGFRIKKPGDAIRVRQKLI